MSELRNGRCYECVVVDLNTQRDFCDAGGGLPVSNLTTLLPAMRRVVAWTKRNCAPIVSSIESHRPLELSDSGRPTVCIDGSGGQRKIEFTIFPLRAMVEVDNTFGVPIDLFKHFQQIIFRKRTDDLLANPKADRLLTQLPVHEFILFGNGIENSIKALTLALRARAKPVTIVVDACGYWNKSAADLALRQIAAKGATLTNVDELLARKLDRRFRRRWRLAIRDMNGHAMNGNGHNAKNGNGHDAKNGNGHNGKNGNGSNGSNGHNGHKHRPGTDRAYGPIDDVAL